MKQTSRHANTRHLTPAVDIRQTDRLDHWCRMFGVTRQQLCYAVATVGSNSDLVRRHLLCGKSMASIR